MVWSDPRKNGLGAWLAAAALAGAGLTTTAVATADVSVGIEVAPEVTISDPQEVTAVTEPPDPIYEEQTELPGPGYVWVGGFWDWRGAEWGWYPGRWLMAPEGRMYIEPYYERVGPNVVYVRGYWGLPGAPRRSYGGERIRFGAPIRPVDYRRGEPPRFERRPGVPLGTRPAGFYEHATGQVRPLPHAAAPYRAAPRETQPAHVQPGRESGRDFAPNHDRAVNHNGPMAPHEPQGVHYAPAPHAGPAARPGPTKRR